MPRYATSDGRDVVFLLAADSDRILRWSLSAYESLPPILIDPVRGKPTHIAYAPESDRLYISHDRGQVTFVDTAIEEHDFVQTKAPVRGLLAAGEFVVVEDSSGVEPDPGCCEGEPSDYFIRHVFDGQGQLTATTPQRERYAVAQAYDPLSRRVFFMEAPPSYLAYDQLDASGAIVVSNQSYESVNDDSLGPIRVSPDGARLYLGTRDTFDTDSRERISARPGSDLDAQWLSDGAVATIRAVDAGTLLERRDARGHLVEAMTVASSPVALVPMGGNRFILVGTSGRHDRATLTPWTPNDDTDGDGTANVSDDFPSEPAAAIDRDRDGAPDAWNPGYESAATTLVLDAYPNDSACQLPGGGRCDITASIPGYVPEQVAVDAQGMIYLLSVAHRRVFRWDAATGRHMNPLVLGVEAPFDPTGPRHMAYSAAHHRLYLGYDSGAVSFVELAGDLGHEQLIGHLPLVVEGVAAVGNFVLAQDSSGSLSTHYIFDAAGVLRDQHDTALSRVFTYDPVTGRVYYLSHPDSAGAGAVLFDRIDPTSGAISETGRVPAEDHDGAIRVSPDGARVLIGSGDVFDAPGMVWNDNVFGTSVSTLADGQWLAGGGVVTLRDLGNSTLLDRRDANFASIEQRTIYGTPHALLPVGDAFCVVTSSDHPRFTRYEPNDDVDADGVPNRVDDFPGDPAAAVDSDNDGFPDTWNPGQSEATSTTLLSLDAFPNDSACSSSTQGPLGFCDIEAAMGLSVPEDVASDETGIIYLRNSQIIARWNSVDGAYENPIVLRWGDPYISIPRKMALSSSSRRLYFGYPSGAITYIDLDGDVTVEHRFTVLPDGILELTAMGSLLHASIETLYSGRTHVVVDAAGGRHPVEREIPLYRTNGYSFDGERGRVYFFEDFYGLSYETFDLTTGVATDMGRASWQQELGATQPIRVSPDGERILIGAGDIYEPDGLTRSGGLPNAFVDARWLSDGGVVTLRSAPGDTSSGSVLERRTAELDLVEAVDYLGRPLALTETAEGLVVVTYQDRTRLQIYRAESTAGDAGDDAN